MTAGRPWNPWLLGFECASCRTAVDLAALVPTCPECGRPLVAHYDLAGIARAMDRRSLQAFGADLWRYQALLPFAAEWPTVRLGEGGTPLLPLRRLAARLGVRELWIKDEAGNPTQSFKARGLAMAINGAVVLGKGSIAL